MRNSLPTRRLVDGNGVRQFVWIGVDGNDAEGVGE
jgi:hypothetical protein